MSETVGGRAAAPRERLLSWQRVAEYVIVVAIVLESIVFAVIAPQFLSVPNLVNVALSIAITGILAVGMTAVILTGGIDLSVGSVAAVAGVVAAMIAATEAPGAMRCMYGSTPARFSPLLRTPMKTAPHKVAMTLPRPPFKDVPPTTTAAITSSSY